MTPYKERFKEPREIYINGELVSDPISCPWLKGAIAFISDFYELQRTEPHLYMFQQNGVSAHISLMVPHTKADLARKRAAYKGVAERSFGMLGRTPDFMNAAIAAIGSHADVLGKGQYTNFAENAEQYYALVKQQNLFVCHASINPQIDRSQSIGQQVNNFTGVHVRRFNNKGVVVSGAKMIATLAPIADEIVIFNMPGLKPGDEDYAIAFSVPTSTPGLKMICRKPLINPDCTLFDHPLANLFDEMDSYLIFDDVFIPWERVFVFKSIEKSDGFYIQTFARHHTGHQGIVRGLTKAHLLAGIAIRLAQELRLDSFLNIQEHLGEITAYLEMLKGLIALSEEEATMSEQGVMTPKMSAIQSFRYNFPKIHERMIQIIRSLAAGSMLSTPHHSDFENGNAATLENALRGSSGDASTRAKLLNLAWDVSGADFGQRQLLFEYYNAGDPVRIAAQHYSSYDSSELLGLVESILGFSDTQDRSQYPKSVPSWQRFA